jgi:hypothetical protein
VIRSSKYGVEKARERCFLQGFPGGIVINGAGIVVSGSAASEALLTLFPNDARNADQHKGGEYYGEKEEQGERSHGEDASAFGVEEEDPGRTAVT